MSEDSNSRPKQVVKVTKGSSAENVHSESMDQELDVSDASKAADIRASSKTEEPDESKPWYKRTPIIVAIVAGAFAVIGAVVTGFFGLLGSK